MSRVTEKMMSDYLNKYNIDRRQLYFLYSIGLDERIRKRVDEIAEEAGFKQVTWIEAGAVISTHGGPGAFWNCRTRNITFSYVFTISS